MSPQLIIVAGPTAVGKTDYAVGLARQLQTEIVSCDSRQFYREMSIGVARPSGPQLAAVRHHFIASRSVTDPYNIFDYHHDALRVVRHLIATRGSAVAVGGSGLYIDALLHTPALLPSPTPELRSRLQAMPTEEKRAQLRLLDPDYYARVDLRNPVRLQRALEVCLSAGRPYSAILAEQQQSPQPLLPTEVRLLSLPPDELRRRIDSRVDLMMQQGLLDEVRSLLPFRHLSTLNTVGYRELFDVVDPDGSHTPLDVAVSQIKLNTWHYARKQNTWMRKYRHLVAAP